MAKKVAKNKAGQAGKVRKPNKIGEATAKKLKSKMQNLNRDEEIESIDSGDRDQEEERFLVGMSGDEGENDKETAEEKRLRMTKQIIRDYAIDQGQDFFANLTAKTQTDMQILNDGDSRLTKHLKL